MLLFVREATLAKVKKTLHEKVKMVGGIFNKNKQLTKVRDSI